MKRYLVFSHAQYYPGGGWSDSCGLFADLEAAKRANILVGWGGATNPDHCYIIDLETETEVSRLVNGVWFDVDEKASIDGR